jgi:hypothetical protein
MEPMGFVVAIEPFCFQEEHRYFVAEHAGRVVQVLSAVPLYARRGWLVEDLLRDEAAPNGTTELLIDALMTDVEGEAEVVTLGLAPLSGPVPGWLELCRALSRPLYDFAGLRAFKQRLHPSRWEPVWLAYPAGGGGAVGRAWRALRAVIESLRAFAGGSLFGFGWRSLLLHPGGPPWVLALPLIPWTALLLVMALTGGTELLAFSRPALAGWALLDALMAVLLFRAARRPVLPLLLLVAAVAAADAAASVRHLGLVGTGQTLTQGVLRAMATLAPVLGTAALAWAAWIAHRRRRVVQ